MKNLHAKGLIFLKSLTYLLIGLVVLLLPEGYFFLLDMTWGPSNPVQKYSQNTYLINEIIILINKFISPWLSQFFILFSIIVIAIAGSYRLTHNSVKSAPLSSTAMFSVSVYLFNPFFYTRLVTGQWLVLVGYALLPWTILATWRFFKTPNFKLAWPVLAWLVVVGLTSIHTLGIAALVAIVMFSATLKIQLKQKLLWGAGIIGSWVIVNLIWLIPLLNGTSKSGQSIQSFGDSQLKAFATNGTIFDSSALSALFLTGFWADDQGRYSLPSDFGTIWYIAAALLFSLMMVGLVFVIKRKDKLGISIAISGFIAWILAVGVAWNVTAPLTYFLHEYLPLYAGYREPQKWLMLLAVAYAYLGAVGLGAILDELKKRNLQSYVMPVFFIALMLPILFTPNLAWGAGGQLKSVQYPKGWESAANALQDVPDDTKILVLPWHMYLHVGFADRIVANPTRYYFTQDMIVGNNPELKGVPPVSNDELSDFINNTLLPRRNVIKDAGTQLGKYDVKYIMLLKEADYRTYGWVEKQTDLVKILDNDSMTLYKIKELNK